MPPGAAGIPGGAFMRDLRPQPSPPPAPRARADACSLTVGRVSDALPPSLRSELDDPFAQLTGALADTRRLSFEVISSERISPSMQRITLTAPELAGFRYDPGQDVMLLVGADGRRPIRRRYTIRALDRATLVLTLIIVRHSDGPGERWLRAARPGDRIEGIGPRGKITTFPGADWHLLIGDESALAAIFAMTESLPGDAEATLVIEVPEPGDEQELLVAARTRLSWLHRLGRAAGDPALLAAEAAEIDLPPGDGHAYVFGEATMVSRLRDILTDRGLRQQQISAKAYWGLGRANAGHGEPARDP